MFLNTKRHGLPNIFIIINEKTSKRKKGSFNWRASPVAQRSARVNKNSYKKPFTFPSYKIYLWGILPGKSPTETKDWPGCPDWATFRTCDQCMILEAIHKVFALECLGLCFSSSYPWHLPNGSPQIHIHHLIPQGDPLENTRKSECSIDFSFSVRVVPASSFILAVFQSLSKSSLQSFRLRAQDCLDILVQSGLSGSLNKNKSET